MDQQPDQPRPALERVVTETHWLGVPTKAIWCPVCLLPSRWSSQVAVTPLLNPTFVLVRGVYSACTDCDWTHLTRL